MRPVDLNFAGTPFRNNTPYYLGYGLGAALIVAFTLYNALALHAYSQDNAELEQNYQTSRAKLESLRREAADLQVKIDKVDLGAMNGRASFTNGLLERRRFSWTDLLNSLEEAQVYQVRLLSLLPRIQEKGIVIDARAVAHDLKAMWNFQQNLINHPKFRRVYPGGWTKSTEEGEIVFNLAFNYFPQGAPEGVQGLTPQEAGMQDFIEAPGMSGEAGDEADNRGDEPAPDEASPPRKTPSAKGKPGSPTPGDRGAGGGLANAANAADPRREKSRAAVNPAADLAAAETPVPLAAPSPAPGARAGFGMPVGSTGATGAAGPATPARRGGRGLPPGSNGVRPPPPPKPDVPMVPVGGKDDKDGGDDN